MKERGVSESVRGRFDWLRRDLVVVAGGSFFLETPRVLECFGVGLIFFRRDLDGYWLLNLDLNTLSKEHLIVEDNDWLAHGRLEDLDVSVSGKDLALGCRTEATRRLSF
jgi:hypothetical protein